ncbi:efflux RND transporter periplasmic adaptor subunit [Stenotrophomonas sp. S41]|uniref:efflux RND transporter periplasmic adaptor subunit n=1 Tax=Stenotrophomonas sp. S41 TaxID=2767464 RepID=UPI001F47A056|nr:efflux RND transporter periplasmic adaptor subunit [Stenotrophomonas sp. S41]
MPVFDRRSSFRLPWRLMPASALALALAACSPAQAPQQHTAEVVATPVVTRSLAVEQSLAGRTVAAMVSDVRPQVGGIIRSRAFTEGALVDAGQLLYQIDPRSYQAAYDSAKGSLAQAEAAVLSSRPKAERYRNLVDADAVSRQDADDAQATLRANEAAVVAARAALQTAKINLDYTRVTAPISGRIGTSTYTPGALVSAGQDTALATIQQLDPIHVDVSQTSAQLLALRRQLDSGALQAVDGKAQVRIVLEDGSTYAHTGTLEVVGTAVDTGTGNVTLRATVPNPEGLLLPGTYVRAVLPMAVDPNAILVPQTAVTRNTKGEAQVKLVGADGKVVERVIQTSAAQGDQWVVSSGLKAGEQLITEGGSKVGAGQAVKVAAAASATAGNAATAAAKD